MRAYDMGTHQRVVGVEGGRITGCRNCAQRGRTWPVRTDPTSGGSDG